MTEFVQVKIAQQFLLEVLRLKLLSAIKSYVLKVAAYADPDDAGSEILSTALLLPLSKWKDKASKKNRDEAERLIRHFSADSRDVRLDRCA
jgi:hypothetical protein